MSRISDIENIGLLLIVLDDNQLVNVGCCRFLGGIVVVVGVLVLMGCICKLVEYILFYV